jgi:hypothetical protein
MQAAETGLLSGKPGLGLPPVPEKDSMLFFAVCLAGPDDPAMVATVPHGCLCCRRCGAAEDRSKKKSQEHNKV